MKRTFTPMAISALLVASMFSDEGRPGFSLGRGMRFDPDPPPADDKTTDDKTTEEDDDKEPEGLSPEAKAWFEKQLEKTKTQTQADIDKAKEDGKLEAKAELDRQKKADDRKKAKDKATEEGNVAEQLRLAREEAKEEARKEHETKLAAVKNENRKIEIAQKHKLPAGWHKRLLGTTEKEWELDAAELAKGQPPRGSKTELEGGERGTGDKEQQVKSATARVASVITGF